MDFRRGRAGARFGAAGRGGTRGVCAGSMRVRGLSLPPSLPMAGTGGTVDARGPIAEETKEPHGPGAALSLQGQEGAPRPPKRQRTRHRLAPAAPAAFIASSRAGCGTSLLGDLHPTDTPSGGLHPSASYHRSGGNHPTPRGKAQAREGPAPAGRGLRSGQGTRPPRGWGFWGASGPSQVSPARPRVLLTTGKKKQSKKAKPRNADEISPPPKRGGRHTSGAGGDSGSPAWHWGDPCCCNVPAVPAGLARGRSPGRSPGRRRHRGAPGGPAGGRRRGGAPGGAGSSAGLGATWGNQSLSMASTCSSVLR